MIRDFKWFLLNTPGPRYDYQPWAELPVWLRGILDAWHPDYVPGVLARIEFLIQLGTLDELGNFIEGVGAKDRPGIHGWAHMWISRYEETQFGKQPESDMGSQHTAPFNEHFWGLHGWIDGFYARWQQLRGDVPDVTPLPPHPNEPKLCDECLKTVKPSLFDTPRLLEREVFADIGEALS